jgi:hypothetical protein
MKRLALLVCALGATLPSSAQVLWDNGPLQTGTLSGNDVSMAESTGTAAGGATNSLLGTAARNETVSGSNPQHIADNFTVPVGMIWNITNFRFYGYQTNSGTTSTLNGVYFKIWSSQPGDPDDAAMFGDFATNRMTSTSFTGIYRIASGAAFTNNRPIMQVDAAQGTPVVLTEGTYWISWAFTGSTALTGPWMPPVTPSDQGIANAMVSANFGSFVQFQSSITNNGTATGSFLNYEAPFVLEGTAVPEPGTMIALGAGALGLLARRRRKTA